MAMIVGSFPICVARSQDVGEMIGKDCTMLDALEISLVSCVVSQRHERRGYAACLLMHALPQPACMVQYVKNQTIPIHPIVCARVLLALALCV